MYYQPSDFPIKIEARHKQRDFSQENLVKAFCMSFDAASRVRHEKNNSLKLTFNELNNFSKTH
ncbi:UNVERIFIED_ORG: hypothetical protein J2Y77_005808 [Pseudomonas lini]